MKKFNVKDRGLRCLRSKRMAQEFMEELKRAGQHYLRLHNLLSAMVERLWGMRCTVRVEPYLFLAAQERYNKRLRVFEHWGRMLVEDPHVKRLTVIGPKQRGVFLVFFKQDVHKRWSIDKIVRTRTRQVRVLGL